MRIGIRALAGAAAVALFIALPACGRKQDNQPPVAAPSLTLSKQKVPIGSPVTLEYKFQVEPNTHLDKNYWVFVHVLDSEGEQMWTDDHVPPTPTTQWQPGQTIDYKRTIFVPNYPYIGKATVRLGLYDPATGQRLPLKAQEASRREYVVSEFEVLPSSENVYLLYKDGWQQAEVDARNPANSWQWTKKTAVLSFRNPRKDALFYLEYDARPDQFTPPQQVTLKIGDQVIGQFAADAKNPALKTFPISAAQLGSGDMTDLVIDVDRTFSPGGSDPRELGIRVYHAYLEVK